MSAAIREGHVTSAELVVAAIRSIEAWQPLTNAASDVWPEEALAAAHALPAQSVGPLHGVPVLVKDLFDVAGHDTTGCCEAFRGNLATADAFVVTRLREAGAIIIGKTNMHELAASGTNHVSSCGPTRNPWAPDRLTGGSSGGSAAAVATRSVPFALGTDTAGSIRVPSSFCGTVGLKPTHGRIPMAGAMPLSPSLGCIGPMAATVEDVALGYAVLTNQHQPIPAVQQSLRGVRIGLVHDGYFARLIHPAIRGALGHVADVLAAAGATLVESHLPNMDGALHTWGDIAWPEFAVSYPDLDLHRVGREIVGHYRYGQHLSATDQALAHQHAARIQAEFATALGDADALLLPATAYPAPRFVDEEIVLGDGEALNVFRGGPVWFTCPIDIALLPALSFPAGFDTAGLPLGVQLVGRFADEWTLLRIGLEFQARTTHHLRTPRLPPS
ncbi:amidase [Terrabacter sp. MAHUQ-38]|uniref:amidase n=1 Tax=unclassified Terrabacter TaxID=2630222 RepID=UPI00165E2B3B|nr:amidase [Terrabacter sp. MAHUQ-38]MBC9822896.1 amidase [Terrabacter sp. MAHUQ-38]